LVKAQPNVINLSGRDEATGTGIFGFLGRFSGISWRYLLGYYWVWLVIDV
jgi:hypothetical protein